MSYDDDFQPLQPLEQQPWRNQTQLVTTLSLAVVVGLIIGALYLIQTTTTTTTARQLEQMNDHRLRLETENERLRAEIANLQSLPNLMATADAMGFRNAEPSEIEYVIVEGYRYKRPVTTPTPAPTDVAAEPEYDDTLSGWIQKQFDAFKKQFEDWRSDE